MIRRFHADLHPHGAPDRLKPRDAGGDRDHFTEYFVNAPPAWLSEFGPSAA